MYEHEFYNVEREIAAYNNINLPDKLKLDFKEPEYPKTVQDQILLDEHSLRHHMLDHENILHHLFYKNQQFVYLFWHKLLNRFFLNILI